MYNVQRYRWNASRFKGKIYNLLKTNEHYAKLQLDLYHLKFKDRQKYSLQ